METAALIISLLSAVLSAIATIVSVRAVSAANESINEYAKAQTTAERNQLQAENERDTEKAVRVRTEAERDSALLQLHEAETKLVDALKENAHAAVLAIRSAPDSDSALDAFNKLLKKVPRLPATNASGTSGRTGNSSP